APRLAGAGRSGRERREAETRNKPGALGLALHVTAQRRLETELVEQRRAQFGRQLAHPRERAVDQRDRLGIVAIVTAEVQPQRRQHLAEVVVQLAGDRAPLGFLRLDQLARERPELLALLLQLGGSARVLDG